jgi:CheY-like chemotaxis protein
LLLVEDGVANQRLAIGLLERWGHTVVVAENGAVALQLHESMPFDAVLMDLQMPVMDGLEATRRIRALEAETGQHIPIIAMTAHALVGDRERCLAVGMDGYVSKPIRRRELIEALAACSEPDPESSRTQPAADSTVPQRTDSLNLDAALRLMENDRELLKIVVEESIGESPKLIGQIATALENREPQELQRAVHTLKANFRNLCMTEMSDQCQIIEDLAKQGRVDEIPAPFDVLRTQTLLIIEQLKLYLQQ